MEPITWTQFHLDIAKAIKGRTRPVSVWGLSVGGAFAAQFLATATQGEPIELRDTPDGKGLAIDIYPTEAMQAVASLGIDCISIYPVRPSEALPWEGFGDATPPMVKGPKLLASLFRELAGYLELNG